MTQEWIEVRTPQLEVNDESAQIVEWYVEAGESISKEGLMVSLETAKAVTDVPSEFDGFLYPLVQVGEDVHVGDVIALVSSVKNDAIIQNFKDSISERDSSVDKGESRFPEGLKITKKAEKLANSLNISLESLPAKRILRESDILKLKKQSSNPLLTSSGKDSSEGSMDEEFLTQVKNDSSFKNLESTLKTEIYRRFGAVIEDGVEIGKGTLILCKNITIGKNTKIGKNSYIEANEFRIGIDGFIGDYNNWVADSIKVNHRLRSANSVTVDVSGGKSSESRLIIGNNCLLCEKVYINACRSVTLGNNSCLSPRSMLYTHSYWQSILEGYDSRFAPVVLEDHTWIGGGAQVMPGCIVKQGAIAMANSVVVNNVPKKTLVGGIPAKELKKIIKTPNINQIFKQIIEYLSLRLE